MTSRNPLHGLPAEVKARLRERAQPRWVAPMLATLTDGAFRERDGCLNRSGMASAAWLFAAAVN
jgi:hypothetical protein